MNNLVLPKNLGPVGQVRAGPIVIWLKSGKSDFGSKNSLRLQQPIFIGLLVL